MAINPLLVALDVPDVQSAQTLAQQLAPYVGGFKIGLELWCACGPRALDGLDPEQVFLDLKLHDIPNTVASAVRQAAKWRPMMLNVHCLGGREMMHAAKDAASEVAPNTKIIGVTILTSHDDHDLRAVGLNETAADAVRRLARLAQDAGLDGVVCSPREIELVRQECGRDFLLVTPGIRPLSADVGDQKRVMTPRDALQAGADYLVVGRPITGAPDPAQAARDFLR